LQRVATKLGFQQVGTQEVISAGGTQMAGQRQLGVDQETFDRLR
jgi:hypothetical protein